MDAQQVQKLPQVSDSLPGLRPEEARAAVAEPDREDVGGIAGFDVELAVADHPAIRWFHFKFLNRETQRRRIRFEGAGFARHQHVEAEVVESADSLCAG